MVGARIILVALGRLATATDAAIRCTSDVSEDAWKWKKRFVIQPWSSPRFLDVVLRLSSFYRGLLQCSAACFLTLPIAVFKLMTDNVFQGLCIKLCNYSPQQLLPNVLWMLLWQCTAQWISHAKVLRVFKTWVWRREIQKKPNSQLCTRPAGKTITSKSWPELLWEAFSLLNLQKIYAFLVQDGKYSAPFVSIPSLPTNRTWTCKGLCFWCQ